MPSNFLDVVMAGKVILVNGVTITGESTVWTPATGSRFRLLGYNLVSATATGNVTVKDGTGLTTVLLIPMPAVGSPTGFTMIGGQGIVSGAANRVLTFTGASTQVVTGWLYGIEE